MTQPATHDLGGASALTCVPVDTAAHTLSEFDRTVDAIRVILGRKRVMSVDELRRGIEQLPAEDYARLGYYPRWLRSILAILLEKGVLTEADLAQGPTL